MDAAQLVDMEEQLPSESWKIDDLETLDWALSRLADMERELEENEHLEKEAIQRVKLRAEVLSRRAKKGADFFRSVISAYAETHKEELLKGGKKKSRTLLHGSVGWRKTGGKLEVQDRDALLVWAQAQPVELNLVRIKEEPAVDEVKLLHGRTGEVPPGCDLTPEGEEIQIKPALGGAQNGN